MSEVLSAACEGSSVALPPRFAAFLQFCTQVAGKGWHEYNGGNVSMVLPLGEVADVVACYPMSESEELAPHQLPFLLPELAGACVMVTASGCLMKNVADQPCVDTGIIQIDEAGSSYSVVAGFQQGKKPTSEVVCHLMAHAVRRRIPECQDCVVYHAHTPSLIALSHMVQPLESWRLTVELWSTFTECPLFCPQGVGIVDFKVPGSVDLAVATASQFAQYKAVLWAKHGLIATGASLDDVYGLVETLEKAARIALDVRSATSCAKAGCAPAYASIRNASMLTQDDLRQMDEALQLHLNPDVLEASWE